MVFNLPALLSARLIRMRRPTLAALLLGIFLRGNIIANLLHTFYTLDVTLDRVIRVTNFDDKGSSGSLRDTFDYIVVGAGSAGCVVTSRLTEDPNVTVLLLEAGGDPNPLQAIPVLALPFLNRPYIDWQYLTQPQKNACQAMKNRACAWPRGKSLGGSSNLDFMVYVRGCPRDFDNWANLTEDGRWAYENVLKFFKKSENYQGEWDNENDHGQRGPMTVTHSSYKGMAELFVKAGAEFGFPRNDPSGQFSTEGFSPVHCMQKNGRRHSVFNAFLKPARRRTNLLIYKFSHVTQILFNDLAKNRAVGVKYWRHGQERVAYARREVIISAGALNTPQILMLSGIGPKNHLDDLKIPIRSDLPVGQNLQDHIASFIGPFIVESPVSFNLDRDVTLTTFKKFLTLGHGPLASSSSQATAFLASQQAIAEGLKNWPDLQFELIGTSMGSSLIQSELTRVTNLRPEILPRFFKETRDHQDSFLILNILNHPKSRGQIRLESKDPMRAPLFDPNYLDHEDDLLVLMEGAKRAVQLVEKSKTFKAIGGRLTKVPFPECTNFEFRSDAYWRCYHRQFSLTAWHPCCTAAMGTVVDSELRVIGTNNLRVIDASVMPTIVSGNIGAATVMIGEMGAHFVKSEPLRDDHEESVLSNSIAKK